MTRTGLVQANSILDEATSRDFKGGLDVADSELNLSSKFSRQEKNVLAGIDGSKSVRQGCRLFSDIAPLTIGHIINYQYFAGNIIAIDNYGQVFAVNGQGVATRIWDADIAAAKRPGLITWGATSFVGFLEFNSQLIAANGKDKPLVIPTNLIVDYLADLASGSNINVPISAIINKFNRHAVFAIGSVIHVSERDAAGTWTGDSGVQFAGVFDLATYVTVGSSEIIGLLPYKNFLLVYFRECIVPVQFTEVTDPSDALQISVAPDSVITNYGTIAPRTLQDIGDMTLALDIVGVANTQLTTFTKILSPDRPSRLVDPLLQKATGILDTLTLHDHCFAIYDRRLSMYMLMIPNDDEPYHRQTHGFGFRYIDNLKIQSWNTYEGWNWHCATRSSEGRLFFTRAHDTAIFVLGDEINDPIYTDYAGEQETFSDNTTFTDQTGLSPVADVNNSGVPIAIAWELPWTDLKRRGFTKTLRYVIVDTEGDQQFNIQVYVDDMYILKDGGEPFTDGTRFTDGTGFIYGPDELPRTPALESERIAKDAGGYGIQAYGSSPYGGGNNAGIRNITLMPTKFNTMKLRFEGEVSGPLKFIAITLLYQNGSVRRLQL